MGTRRHFVSTLACFPKKLMHHSFATGSIGSIKVTSTEHISSRCMCLFDLQFMMNITDGAVTNKLTHSW